MEMILNIQFARVKKIYKLLLKDERTIEQLEISCPWVRRSVMKKPILPQINLM